jgi:hypothetical protein
MIGCTSCTVFRVVPLPATETATGESVKALVSLLVLLWTCPSLAAAQFSFVEGLFKNVTDVSMYWTFARFADRPPELAGGFRRGEAQSGGLGGLGFEVLFAVGEFSERKLKPGETGVRQEPDSAEQEPELVEIRDRQPDGSVLVYKPEPEENDEADDKDYRWSAELALGYSELRGFESAVSGTDVRGVLRELPAVSLYITWQPEENPSADEEPSIRPGWYWGVRTGLAELHGLRGYLGSADDGTADEIYVGGGSTFQFGLMAGAFVEIGSLALFVEPAYTHRNVSGVEWTADNVTLADGLPRSLDMSTWSLSLGGQLGVGLASGE